MDMSEQSVKTTVKPSWNTESSESPEPSVPDGRCGYVFESRESFSDRSGRCCLREPWNGDGYCKWHLDSDKADVLRTDDFRDETTLHGAVFRGAIFSRRETLAGRQFPQSDFSGSDLANMDLSGADLAGADLSNADLRHADFTGANLQDADLTDANARGATFEDANLENCTVTRTNFRNSDIRNAALYEIAFSDTWINENTDIGDFCRYEAHEQEIKRDTRTIRDHEAAAWTYRALQQLCEQNALPKKHRRFYVREKEARRKLAWEEGRYRKAVKAELSRWVMEHGSNPWRVIGVSAVIILLFAVAYPLVGGLHDTATDDVIGYLSADTATDAPKWYFTGPFLKGLYFSVVTFTTLGFGDMKPMGKWARFLATSETIIGSVLIALLVFVLSRTVTW
jgi:hypothetical protein